MQIIQGRRVMGDMYGSLRKRAMKRILAGCPAACIFLLIFVLCSKVQAQPSQWRMTLEGGIPKYIGEMSSELWGHAVGGLGVIYYPGSLDKVLPYQHLLGIRLRVEAMNVAFRTTEQTRGLASSHEIADESRIFSVRLGADVSLSPWPMIDYYSPSENIRAVTPYLNLGVGYVWYSPRSAGGRKYYEGPFKTSYFLAPGLGIAAKVSYEVSVYAEGRVAYHFQDDLEAIARPDTPNDAIMSIVVGVSFALSSAKPN